jgi:hypothetical protein
MEGPQLEQNQRKNEKLMIENRGLTTEEKRTETGIRKLFTAQWTEMTPDYSKKNVQN